jgi:curved DNA-binding protein CbpA
MDKNKDYYAILGVLPTAEDVVIRAAYKALAQRYHPDRTRETGPDASKRMALINEAYAVLSDPVKRKEYDALRGSNTQSGGSYFEESNEDVPPSFDPLEKDWKLASTYYPDLPELEAQLSRIAWRLGYSFRAYMLAEKAFEKREQVASEMEQKFLELYFGTNSTIVEFAKHLISLGNKAAAKELNEAIRVLGDSVNPEIIVKQINFDFELSLTENQQKLLDAIWEGNCEKVYNLLRENVRPEGIWDEKGRSPLDLAKLRGDSLMIRLLKSFGAR